MQGNKGIYPKMELGEFALIQKPDFLTKTRFIFTKNNLNALVLDAQKPGFYTA
jgi:hypothetical protein